MKVIQTNFLTLLGFLLLLRMSSIIESNQFEPALQERNLKSIVDHKHDHHSHSKKNFDRRISTHSVRHRRGLQDDENENSKENENIDNEEEDEEDNEDGSNDGSSAEEDSNEEQDENPTEPQIEFEQFNELEHMINYKRISTDMQFYENEYGLCIKEIKDENYTEESLDECLGKNFIKVSLDLKYIIMKVMAKADEKIRRIFISDCYGPAGLVQEFSNSCDLMERDLLDLLWNGLDFIGIVDLNKSKYLTEYGLLPESTYSKIYEKLAPLSKEIFELLDELDSHKEITILRLKTLIDDRTKLILEEAQNHPSMVQPAVVQHRIEITENLVSDEGEVINFLPEKQFKHEIMRKKKERELGQIADQKENREKENSLRVMNSDNSYHELNGNNRDLKVGLRNRDGNTRKYHSSFVSKLGKSASLQSSSPFKNIHTKQLRQN